MNPDATRALRAAVYALAHNAGELIVHTEESYSDFPFFVGVKHSLTLIFEGPYQIRLGEDLLRNLKLDAFEIPGFRVIHAIVRHTECRFSPPRLEVECEFLLMEKP